MHVGLLSGEVLSPFGEKWLAESHRGGITSRMNVSAGSCASAWHEHSKLGAAASTKAVWWDWHLASLLTHLLPHHRYYGWVLSLLYFCFVCLFVCLFVRLRISQQRKKLGVYNFACMLAYYPDRSSPRLVKISSWESRGRRHYFPHHALSL